ncbi:MAG: hypothetical protein Q4F17_02185 [Eubacteriales bacterium]|nr:hypothetical protein [Eubacteriales bacterium]
MILELEDWMFRVDVEATRDRTAAYALDHCQCGYCKNYYETVAAAYPGIPAFLDCFGVNLHGPVEVMPFEPTYVLACYRVTGDILHWGTAPIQADGIPVSVGAGEEGTFHLWIGEMDLPWVQAEPEEDVVSPANLPEFMERMEDIWNLRHGEAQFCS